MSSFRVLLTDRAWPDSQLESQILSRIDAELIEAPDSSEATLIKLAGDVDAIATNWARITPDVVAAARRCRHIARLGIGLDNIPVDLCTRRRILVTNVPDYCVGEVADHTLGLILALARKIGFYHLRTKRGEYELQVGPGMRRLTGQTLGLVGLGRIARHLIPKAQVLGLNVIAYTASGDAHGSAIRMVGLTELLKSSDYVSLHLPLTAATKGLLGVEEFELMRPSAYLINTSRGALVDPQALLVALERNLIAGAALDVFDPEPPDLSQPLYRDERVIVTPHAAFVSEEAVTELRTRVACQILHALQGQRPANLVNPEAYAP